MFSSFLISNVKCISDAKKVGGRVANEFEWEARVVESFCFDFCDYKRFLGEDILRCLNTTSHTQIQNHSDIKLRLFLVLFIRGHKHVSDDAESTKRTQDVKKRETKKGWKTKQEI